MFKKTVTMLLLTGSLMGVLLVQTLHTAPLIRPQMPPAENVTISQPVNSEITNVLEAYYSTYMDAFLGEEYPDFSPYVQKNENTELYDIIIRYELDSGRYLGPKAVAYDFDMTVQALQAEGLSASADVIYCVTIRFDGMDEGDATIRVIPCHFQLVQTDTGWRIAEIESGFFVHTAFMEELSRMRSGDPVAAAAELAAERLEGLREADLDLLRQGDESSAAA